MKRKVLISELENQLKPIAERLDSLENRLGRLETEVAACKSQTELFQIGSEIEQPEIPCDEIIGKLDNVIAELQKVWTVLTFMSKPEPPREYIQPERHEEYNGRRDVYTQPLREEPASGYEPYEKDAAAEEEIQISRPTEPISEPVQPISDNKSTYSDGLPPKRSGYFHEFPETGEADISDVDFVNVQNESASGAEGQAFEEVTEARREDPLFSDTQVFSNTRLLPFLEGREFVVVRDRKKPATVRFDRSAEGRGIVRYTDNRMVSFFSTPKFLGEYYNLGKTREISAVSVCGSEYSFPRSGDISEQAVFKFVVEDGVLCLYLCTRVWGDEEKGFVYGNEQVVKLARVD